MSKTEDLAKLKEAMRRDTSLPLRDTATQLVFGDGNQDTGVYFLGEAPGFWEDKLGKPFVGRAGQLLDVTLQEINLQRGDVYISNVVRFRPPENRDPTPEEIQAFAKYVDAEIEIINPTVIVTLGRFSMGKFLPNQKISQIHGRVYKQNWQGRDLTIIPMFHPAAALRSPDVMRQFKEDFKVIKIILSEPKEEPQAEPDKEKKPDQLSLL